MPSKGTSPTVSRRAVRSLPAARLMSDFERSNHVAARVILSDVEYWGGESSAMVQWARLFTQRMETEKQEARRKAA